MRNLAKWSAMQPWGVRVWIRAQIVVGLWLLSACSGAGISNVPASDIKAADLSEDVEQSDDISTDVEDTSPPIDTFVPEEDTTGPGDFGTPCQEADDCNSGYCVQSADGMVCSKTCEDSCPDGWSCKQLLSGGDAVYICLPNHPTLCMPCTENAECQLPGSGSVARCLVMGDEGSFCGGDCETTPCPEGYTCQDAVDVLGQETQQCMKDDALCECSTLAISKTATTTCFKTNDLGTCSAVRQCLEDGLTQCDALEPTDEICDGLDNNCDESVDESVGCDDDNPCTTDSCAGKDGCAHEPAIGTACDDGKPETKGDVCIDDGTCVGEAFECEVPSTCVIANFPDGETCVPEYAEVGTPCNDDNPTTLDDVCDGEGMCSGSPFECPDVTTCIPAYEPNGADCVPLYAEKGVLCSDELITTQGDACDGAGTCTGTPYECPEPTVCISSYMQDGAGCWPNYADQGTGCDDGSDVTKGDVCNGSGTCAGTPFGCPAPTICTPTFVQDGDECTPQHAELGTMCNDGDNTTKLDGCDGNGACAGTPYECPEPTACTPSYNQDGSGCAANHADEGETCDDGSISTKDDACNGLGACFGAPYSCPAPTKCTPSYEQDGSECIPNHAGIEVSCDDDDESTKNDVCDGNGGCAGNPFGCPAPTTCTPSYAQENGQCIPNHSQSGVLCDDGDATTKGDNCSGFGVCSGTAYECPAADDCTPGYAKDGVGCVPAYADKGALCDDGSALTKGDVCDGNGQCAGAPYACPEPTTCTPSYTQDGVDCIANHAGVEVSCNDGDATTKDDVCDGAGGCAGSPFGCPEATTCTPSYTQKDGECIPNHAEVGVPCDDGSVDTKNDVCSGFGVCSGTDYECPAPTTCIPNYTKDGQECLPKVADEGVACNDDNVATKDDVCDGQGGCQGNPYACPEPTSCTLSFTQNGQECLANFADPGVGCDDGDPSTKNDVCDGKGQCGGSPFGCPEPSTCIPSYTQDGNQCLPVYADQGVLCNDGLNATKNDTCSGLGVCSGTAYECPAPTPCTPSHLKDGVGCVPQHADKGSACDDGDVTTKEDVCNGAGACSGSPYACPETTSCTPAYSQDGQGCKPSYADVGAGCNDGDNNTKNDVCDGAGQCSGTPYECPAPTECTPGYNQDGNGCTPNHAAPETSCDDGDPTTQQDVCNGSGICSGNPYSCPQTDACTPGYTQDGFGCTPQYADPGSGCDDGNATTNNDVCNGKGECSGTPYSCPAPTSCTPGYIQDGAGCKPTHAPPGTGCDDGNNATKNDACNGSGSCAGSPYSCPAGTTCTPEYIQDGSGCVAQHAAPGIGCDDKNVATKDDVCDGGGGCAGSPYSCPAPTTCTPSYSQNGAGCVANHAQNGTGCNDGDPTTKDDQCNGKGTCSGSPYSCPEPTTCTPSYSQDGSGCKPNHAAPGVGCNDGNNATNKDVCNGSGTCAGSPYSCPAPTTCTPSYTQNGESCIANHAKNGTGCNDGNNSTKNDVCNGSGTCSGTSYGCPGGTTCTPSYTQDGSGCIPNYANNGTGCNDGNNGTNNDVCNGAGSCSGTPYGCPGGTTCTPSYTQDGSGCVPNYAKSGTGCNDGNNGTNNDVCNGAGSCSGTPYGCPGGTTCTPSYTQDGSGCIANHANYGTGCNDGNNGTKNDICNGSGSCSGTPYGCPGGTTCTPSYSQNGSGCVANHAKSGTGCNDGNNGTKNDVCNGSGSCSGTPYGCPGGTTCTPSYSQNGSGCVANHAKSGTGCNDGNNGTKNDVCNGSGSCSGTPYSCPGGTTCTPSYSQNGSGCVANHANYGTGCNDGSNSTKNDICNGSGSCSGTPYSCPAPTACTPGWSQNGSGCVASHAGPGTPCNDGNPATTGDVCDGSGGCAGKAAVCGNGVVEAGEQCDGGGCCTKGCKYQQNGVFCGSPGWDFGGCYEYTCFNGSCSKVVDTCPWGQHCCEFGCFKDNVFCP